MKTSEIHSVTYDENGFMQIRIRTVDANGKEGWHLQGLTPGEDIDHHMAHVNADLGRRIGSLPIDAEAIDAIKSVAAKIWTKAAIDAHKAKAAQHGKPTKN